MRNLVEGLSWASEWEKSWNVPTKASLYKARARLGPEPLEALFTAVAQPLAAEATKGAFYRAWRLMSVDGTSLDLADTPENEERFGRPGSGRARVAARSPRCASSRSRRAAPMRLSPRARALSSGETTLARGLLRAMRAGMLVLADRNFYSFKLWNEAGPLVPTCCGGRS